METTRPALDADMRSRLAAAALAGSCEAAFSLGYAITGPGSSDMEHGLYWYSQAARLGSGRAIFNAALVAAQIAWFDRPDDMKAAERALGWIWLALEDWHGTEQAAVLEALRVDMLTLWPELEGWEFDASCDQWQAVHGADH